MYREWLKLIEENWDAIREEATWMCRDIYENEYPDGSGLILVIDAEGNVSSKLEDEVDYDNEFVIIELACKQFIEDEKNRVERIEYYQGKVIPELLTKFREDLADKVSDEN
ncbi:hypothetical protein ACJDU8_21625 [Clostridium sp. WILCCON 0269]|uniref:Uncharacterized protein n=1 Tax=Candidatus Clostridium eludens TaxID=3381663 RepID=A0ABW8SSH6_9CLOT